MNSNVVSKNDRQIVNEMEERDHELNPKLQLPNEMNL